MDPSVPIGLSEKAKKMGHLFIDAPVSGGRFLFIIYVVKILLNYMCIIISINLSL